MSFNDLSLTLSLWKNIVPKGCPYEKIIVPIIVPIKTYCPLFKDIRTFFSGSRGLGMVKFMPYVAFLIVIINMQLQFKIQIGPLVIAKIP